MNPLKLAILQELAHAPRGILLPHTPLRNAVRWAVIPQPEYNQIDEALADLASSSLITPVTSEIYGTRWGITDAGRAALQS